MENNETKKYVVLASMVGSGNKVHLTYGEVIDKVDALGKTRRSYTGGNVYCGSVRWTAGGRSYVRVIAELSKVFTNENFWVSLKEAYAEAHANVEQVKGYDLCSKCSGNK